MALIKFLGELNTETLLQIRREILGEDDATKEAEEDVEQEEEVEGGKDQGQVLCLPMQPQVGALFEQGLLEVVGVEGQ